MSIEPTNPVELPHPCAGLEIVAFENISTWPGHDKDPKFTKNPILFNDNNPLVRLADVKKLVDDLTRSQPSTGKADGWAELEKLILAIVGTSPRIQAIHDASIAAAAAILRHRTSLQDLAINNLLGAETLPALDGHYCARPLGCVCVESMQTGCAHWMPSPV